MSQYHVEAVFAQFHWLSLHFSKQRSSFSDAQVGKFNFEFLSVEAGYWDYDMFGSGYRQIFLFSADGAHIANVHPKSSILSRFICISRMRRVDDALIELGEKVHDVRYAVLVNSSFIKVFKPLTHYPPAELIKQELLRRKAEREQALKDCSE